MEPEFDFTIKHEKKPKIPFLMKLLAGAGFTAAALASVVEVNSLLLIMEFMGVASGAYILNQITNAELNMKKAVLTFIIGVLLSFSVMVFKDSIPFMRLFDALASVVVVSGVAAVLEKTFFKMKLFKK